MSSRSIRPRRSFIFTPGLRPEMYPKALASGADIVCVELEDGIAPQDKAEARRNALALFEKPQADDGVERIVRINSMRERFGIEDVQAVLATNTPPPALMMPKIRTPDEVVILDQLLSEVGHATRLHVIIETNAGLEAAHDIAHCSERIDAMFFGGVDMAAELRCENAWDALLYARSRVVHAASSAGLDVIDVPYLDLDDPDGMRAAARKGTRSRFCRKRIRAPETDCGAQRGVHALGGADRRRPQDHRTVRGGGYRSCRHRRQTDRKTRAARDVSHRRDRGSNGENSRGASCSAAKSRQRKRDDPMPQSITKNSREIVREAIAAVPSISIEEALQLVDNDSHVFVDLRDGTEQAKNRSDSGCRAIVARA